MLGNPSSPGLLQWSRPQLRTETSRTGGSVLAGTMLQWSRPQLRTETQEFSHQISHDRPASMEPSSVEDGNNRMTRQTLRILRVLQWSRPQLRTETRGILARGCTRIWFASMEPSSVEDGNTIRNGWLNIREEVLQWSRPQLRTETSDCSTQNTRSAVLQWSRPQLRTETSGAGVIVRGVGVGFNGAVLS